MAKTIEDLPQDPVRIKAFASFFKKYMSVSTIVVAALPIPITYWNMLPMFDNLSDILTVITPMFCFLLLGYIFYNRHILGTRMFSPKSKYSGDVILSRKHLPLGLIISSLMAFCIYLYLYFRLSIVDSIETKNPWKENELPLSLICGLNYLLFFVFAEAAFIVMALKEYVQDIIGISDRELIGLYQKEEAKEKEEKERKRKIRAMKDLKPN